MKTVEELLNDKSFIEKLEAAKSCDEVAALFREQGIELTAEELAEEMKKIQSSELSEMDLEDVAGGGKAWNAIKTGGKVAWWLIQHSRFLLI